MVFLITDFYLVGLNMPIYKKVIPINLGEVDIGGEYTPMTIVLTMAVAGRPTAAVIQTIFTCFLVIMIMIGPLYLGLIMKDMA